ncbi:MAG: hypothetical protein U1A78_16040 [Polyangia bacterium]
MPICPVCKIKPLPSLRARHCSPDCRYAAWLQRAAEAARKALALPRMAVPAEMQHELPIGPERLLVSWKYLFYTHAPSGTAGYRLGTVSGEAQILHWFPSSLFRQPPMFRIEPFELPSVPIAGVYVVQFVDVRGQPLGSPTRAIEVEHATAGLRFCDGDRSLKSRSRF